MILTTIAIIAQASPAPAASAAPAAASPTPHATLAPDAKIDANAKAWLLAGQQGKLFDATQFTDQAKAAFTPEVMSQLKGFMEPAGALKTFERVDSGTKNGLNIYVYKATFANATWRFIYVLDNGGKIAGLRVVPAQ